MLIKSSPCSVQLVFTWSWASYFSPRTIFTTLETFYFLVDSLLWTNPTRMFGECPSRRKRPSLNIFSGCAISTGYFYRNFPSTHGNWTKFSRKKTSLIGTVRLRYSRSPSNTSNIRSLNTLYCHCPNVEYRIRFSWIRRHISSWKQSSDNRISQTRKRGPRSVFGENIHEHGAAELYCKTLVSFGCVSHSDTAPIYRSKTKPSTVGTRYPEV